jgi:hypothetical protein
MKEIILYSLFILTAFVSNAQQANDAQPNPQREEKLQALYVAFISQQLKLTPAEAQQFWPVHAQYDAELKAINSSNMPELDKDEAALKVKRKYAASFTKILGADRCNNFNVHDNEFREKIKSRLKELRQQRRQMQDGGDRKPKPDGGGGRRRQNGGGATQ